MSKEAQDSIETSPETSAAERRREKEEEAAALARWLMCHLVVPRDGAGAQAAPLATEEESVEAPSDETLGDGEEAAMSPHGDLADNDFFEEGDAGRYEGGPASLSPEVALDREFEQELASLIPGRRTRRKHRTKAIAAILGAALAMLVVVYLLTRLSSPDPSSEPVTKIAAVKPIADLEPPPAPPPPAPVEAPDESDEAAKPKRAWFGNYTPLAVSSLDEEAEEKRLLGVARGQAVARFPDLPREILASFEEE